MRKTSKTQQDTAIVNERYMTGMLGWLLALSPGIIEARPHSRRPCRNKVCRIRLLG